MNIKLRLSFRDIVKLIFGGTVLVMDPYNDSIIRVVKGADTYVAKW
jgi:hypothetical protein